MEERAQKNPAVGCLKITGIGCLVIVIGLVGLGIFLIVKADDIGNSSWFREAREGVQGARAEMESLIEMSETIREVYPAGNVNIGRESLSGSGPSLKVTFTNPEFDLDPSEEQKAREIASYIVTRFDGTRYREIEIEFATGTDAGIKARIGRSHSFDPDDLGDWNQSGEPEQEPGLEPSPEEGEPEPGEPAAQDDSGSATF